MKKLSVLLLAALMLFTFVSCDETQNVPKVEITATVLDNAPLKIAIPADSSVDSLLQNAQIKLLLGNATDYLVLVNGKVEANTYIFKSGDSVSVVLKGEGSDNSPRLISNADEFLASANAGKSMKFVADITIPANSYIANTYSGTIDGNNHKLIIANPPLEVKHTQVSEYALFVAMSGTIKNLNYETNGFKALVYWDSGNLLFENVNTYGEMNGADTNVGPFIIFVNGEVTFKNCNNYASIIDRLGGNHYGSAFVAGYMMPTAKKVVFDGCNNYGNIFFGKNAGFLMGNPSNLDPAKVTVTNCFNYGVIQAFNSVGVISWPSGAFDDSANISSVNKDQGKIEKITNSITGFSVNADGTFEISTTGLPNARINLQFNIGYNVKGSGTSGGNRNMTLAYKIPADNKLPIAIKQADATHPHESVADGVLYIDPFAYEFEKENYDLAVFPSEIVYYAIDINPDTGLFRGMASCKISK